jgi:hypothetical protein
MYWQEVPYRGLSVARATAQRYGFFTADRVPIHAGDARFGRPWCQVPTIPTVHAAVLHEAQQLLDGRLMVFGQAVPMHAGVPEWNTDPVTGTSIPLEFGLGIDFRHLGPGVDIKYLWELNRHLWWVRLAQAWALTGNAHWLKRLSLLIDDWTRECPYALGANWSSPVEHGVRLINWSLVWHLIGGEASTMFDGEVGQALRQRWLASIYQHMRFASDNYSLYSSADNHLIGEAAGVYVASVTWNCWAEGRLLGARAKALLERESCMQFCADGVNREQALCYHKFSLQFLLAAGLCGRADGDDFSVPYWQRIEAAVTFLAAMTDAGGHVPAIGDSDDGDVFRLGAGEDFDSYLSLLGSGAALGFAGPASKLAALGRAGAADAQVGWLHPSVSAAGASIAAQLPRWFPEGGYAILGKRLHESEELRVVVDCGTLGSNRIAGHGHADALQVLVSWDGEALLVDPGTYCYNAAPTMRHFFRGTSAHNTLQVDGSDQSLYGASFLWLRDVNCSIHEAPRMGHEVLHASHDGYRRLVDPVTHHRRVVIGDDGSILVEDWLECAAAHAVALHWHVAPGVHVTRDDGSAWHLSGHRAELTLAFDCAADHQVAVVEGVDDPPQGWVSTKFYARQQAPVLQLKAALQPGQLLRTRLCVQRRAGAPEAMA